MVACGEMTEAGAVNRVRWVMTAINVVRFRVKPGMDQVFLAAHRGGKIAWPGLSRGVIVDAGERSYVLIGEWPDMTTLAGARAADDCDARHVSPCARRSSSAIGVTDAVSGTVTLALK